MTIWGDASFWADTFPEDLVPEILDLVLEAWGSFPQPARDAHEVPTTRAFRQVLIRNKLLRRLPLRIEREVPEDDSAGAAELGRIDLKLFPAGSAREEVYFAFECKRLNAVIGDRCRSLASEYVTKGMMRFVTEQYSNTQKHGGMIGYVLDGNITRAITRIGRNLRTRQAELCLPPSKGLDESSLLPSRRELRETRHQLSTKVFHIHHVFLGKNTVCAAMPGP